MVAVYRKIETSNFNLISIEGQYMLGVLVEGNSKYLNFFNNENDLISYVDVSYVGFELPAVEIIFTFGNQELIPYLTENTTFYVSVGQKVNDQIQSQFNIITANVTEKQEGKWVARVVGVYDAVDYVKVPVKTTYNNVSSVIAQEILEKSLKRSVKFFGVPRSKDAMLWIQHNQSNYHFLYDLWKHSYTPNSLWMTAIDFDGTPRMSDVRSHAKNLPKYTFTTGDIYARDTYRVLEDFDIRNNSAISNNVSGYKTDKPTYSLDDARKVTDSKRESVVLSQSDTFNRTEGIKSEAPYSIQTSNVHQFYSIAPMQNKSLYMSMRALQIDLTVEGEIPKAQLLDYIMFDCKVENSASTDYSGNYMICKIAHQIANKRLYTHFTICREATNRVGTPNVNTLTNIAESKVSAETSKLTQSSSLLTMDGYRNLIRSYEDKIYSKVEDVKDKIDTTIRTSDAYKKYKDVNQKYQELKNKAYEILTVSNAITAFVPQLNEVTDKLNSITIDTPIDDIRSAMNKYLNLQGYLNNIQSQINSGVQSQGVYNEYQKIMQDYNQATSRVRTLQSYGIIGDLSEYTEIHG